MLAGDLARLLASVALTSPWMNWLLDNLQLQLDTGELLFRLGLASAIATVLTAAIGYAVPPFGSRRSWV